MKIRKDILVIIFILNLSSTLFSQIDSSSFYPDTGVVALPEVPIDSSKLQNDISMRDTLSTIPTLKEIIKLFLLASEKKRDPFVVAFEIADKRDNAIPALKDFLYNLDDQKKDSLKSKLIKASKKFAIYALEEINTEKAIEQLIAAAENYPDKEVRGLAIRAIATNYFTRIKYDSVQPDKELLRVLLKNADDTTYIENCESRIEKISKEGIKNWTGLDYKDFLNVNNKKSFINFYDNKWWADNSNNIIWDTNKRQFIIMEN